MYRNVLVPLDGTAGNEKALGIVKDVLVPLEEIILLRVVSEESQINETKKYLEKVGQELLGGSRHWRYEVKVGRSVLNEVLDAATREGVDLIAMYGENDGNLANALLGSTTANVRLYSPVEVKVFGPQETQASSPFQEVANQV